MSRIAPLSGFPEWRPEGRIVEQHVLDQLRRVFELNGFASVETRAVEPVAQLARKGEIDKEIYVLRRLQAGDAGVERDGRQLGLHFDLTVPLARYVAEHVGALAFPFKRYQIQKVWRGERPQEGRFREFTQADIDVVGAGALPFHYEVELPLVMAEAFASLPIPPVRMHVNNRKLVEGYYRGVGLTDTANVLRIVDKFDKIGPNAVAEALQESLGATQAQARACVALAGIETSDGSFVDELAALGVDGGELMAQGVEELLAVVEAGGRVRPGQFHANLKIARGLDYYTGTVYETELVGAPTLGSICSGGRYDSLVTVGGQAYPGVGLSVGVSRLLSHLLGTESVTATRGVPTAVLVTVADDDHRERAVTVARALRARGIPTDVSPTSAKFGKQIKFADTRGIPYVWFMGDDGASDEVKDIRSGAQHAAAADSWQPPDEDRWPQVIAAQ